MNENLCERIRLAKEGSEDELEALVRDNIALVKSIAKRFLERGVDFEDLVQIGTIGLIRAIRGFDFEYGTALSTYAVPMISGEIKRFLRDDGIIKVGRDIKTNAAKIRRFTEDFEKTNAHSPTTLEIADGTGISSEDIVFALSATTAPTALEWEGEDGKSYEIPIGVDTVEENIDRIALFEALKKLSENEEKLIRLRYFKGLTQQQTADVLGVGQVKVSRDEKKICAKLKTLLE